jgi:hypothetical protein
VRAGRRCHGCRLMLAAVAGNHHALQTRHQPPSAQAYLLISSRHAPLLSKSLTRPPAPHLPPQRAVDLCAHVPLQLLVRLQQQDLLLAALGQLLPQVRQLALQGGPAGAGALAARLAGGCGGKRGRWRRRRCVQ